MPHTSNSILDALPDQPALPGIPEMPDPEETEALIARNPDFTGDRLAKMNPAKYDAIVKLWASGLPGSQISQALSCSRNTVAAVIRHECGSATADEYRKAASTGHRTVASIGLRRLQNMVLDDENEISAWDLARIIQVSDNLAQLLAGGPTARVDYNTSAPAADEYTAELERLRNAQTITLEE